jgi:hypothetical protein
MLSPHGDLRPFPARIAASEAGDFNKANAPVSDKQNYTFGQSSLRDRLAHSLSKYSMSCKNNSLWKDMGDH